MNFILVANEMTKKMDAYLSNGAFVPGVCDLIKPHKIIRFIDDSREHVLILKVSNHLSNRYLELPLRVLATQEATNEALLSKLFFVNFKFINFIREYLGIELQSADIDQITEFKHSNLGFFTYKGERVFLLDLNQLGTQKSEFYDPDFSFSSGESMAYMKMLKSQILTSDEMSFALTVGLSSVVASYLKDYGDIQNLIINLCGPSSTGKTTAAMFMASLWGSPVISNKGLVRTFNATPTSIITSIEGLNGVPIILDDITTSGNSINKTSFLYTLAQGESKARANTNGRLQYQGPKWSGTIIITSETPVIYESETRQGLLARVIDTNDIVWTKSSKHSEDIKNTIINHYGFVGKRFVSEFMRLDDKFIKAKFDAVREELSTLMTIKDNLSNRIINKLAVLYLTAILIKELLRLDEFKVIVQRDLIIKLDQSKVAERHPAEVAIQHIVEFVTEHYHSFNVSVADRELRALAKSKIFGEIRFKGKQMTLIMPTSKVKSILESNKIFEIKPIFTYWRDHGLVKPEETTRTSVKDARFKVRVIKFVFKLDNTALAPFDGDFEHSKETPHYKPSFEEMTESELYQYMEGLKHEGNA